MSKSLGNYVGITEAPNEIFGKMMSIPDDLMWSYWELVTDRTPGEIEALKKEVAAGTVHPMDAKMRLAQEIIAGFHGDDAARKAADNFQRIFRDRRAPEEMREIRFHGPMAGTVAAVEKRGNIAELTRHLISSTGKQRWSKFLVTWAGLESNSAAERLIKQRGLEVNEEIIADPTAEIDFTVPASLTIRVGKKKFLRAVIE